LIPFKLISRALDYAIARHKMDRADTDRLDINLVRIIGQAIDAQLVIWLRVVVRWFFHGDAYGRPLSGLTLDASHD